MRCAGRRWRARYHRAGTSPPRAGAVDPQCAPSHAARCWPLAGQNPRRCAARYSAALAWRSGGGGMSAGSITWVEALELRVRNVLAANDLDGLRILLANRHPADIAEVIDRLDDD